jgi:hypothetical protein
MKFNLSILVSYTLCFGLGGSVASYLVERKYHDGIRKNAELESKLWDSIRREQEIRSAYLSLFESHSSSLDTTSFTTPVNSCVVIDWSTRMVKVTVFKANNP